MKGTLPAILCISLLLTACDKSDKTDSSGKSEPQSATTTTQSKSSATPKSEAVASKESTSAAESSNTSESAEVTEEPISDKANEETVASNTDIPVEEIYQRACLGCHAYGAAGAPKVGDKSAWEPRLAKGDAVLIENAIKGFRAMPPKGGSMALSDEEVSAVVMHMISQSK
ncbi:MAG: c-type cytochrome [Pseudomonadales bacterium]|nr:c-type cytochrome [Pseudomonadales bacterium]